jgi:hypothetical protein
MVFAGSVTIYPPVVSEDAEALGASLVSVFTEHTATAGFGQEFLCLGELRAWREQGFRVTCPAGCARGN